MKKLVSFLGALVLVCGLNAETQKAIFTVNPPLVCNNCEIKVKDNLRFEKGVKSVKPSYKKGNVEVTYDDSKTDVEKIKAGFKKIGYSASLVEPEVCYENGEAPCCNETPQPPCCNQTPQAPCCNETPQAPCCNETPQAPCEE